MSSKREKSSIGKRSTGGRNEEVAHVIEFAPAERTRWPGQQSNDPEDLDRLGGVDAVDHHLRH